MQQKLLNRIRLVENCIENSLSNEDFVSIPALSLDLEKLVKEYAASIEIISLKYPPKLKCTKLIKNSVDNQNYLDMPYFFIFSIKVVLLSFKASDA